MDKLDYKSAGVDIEAGDRFAERIRALCAGTRRPEVIGPDGGFAGLFRMPGGGKQVLAAATDGVGTKLKLAQAMDTHDTVGIDLVAMCVNDILAHGAAPLFFLDYFACGRLSQDTAAAVVAGVAEGCRQAGCALIGGETAEMPGMYAPDEYDLAGFAVGAADEDALCGPQRVAVGDQIVGVASGGVHANGFSLARRIVERSGMALDAPFEGATLGATLLAPTRIYVGALLPLIRAGRVRALAHITGGGLPGNLPRALGAGRQARVRKAAWPRPAVFDWLQRNGNVDEDEMLRVFNCGIGMAVVCGPEDADAIVAALDGDGLAAFRIGEVAAGERGVVYV